MLRDRRTELLVALLLVAPFLAVYGWLFIYPTIRMAQLSLTNAPLIGPGEWVGLDNYVKLFGDRLFKRAVWNTSYFVLLTVIPGTLIALVIALMVSRLKGWMQSLILAAFFLPFILPVTVVYLIWQWMTDLQFGIIQYVIEPLTGQRISVTRQPTWLMPLVALMTIWWTNGFSILLFLAGLRNIPAELYEAADGTFGVTHWKWGAPEQAWFTVGPDGSRCDNAETALREAKSRVAWASDGVLVEPRPLSRQQAKALVQARLDMFGDGPKLVIADEQTIERPWGWVFFYSAANGELLAGNVPYMVNGISGELIETGTAEPIEAYITRYEKRLASG